MPVVHRRRVLSVCLLGLVVACSGGSDELPDASDLPDAPVDAPVIDAQVDGMVDAAAPIPDTTILSGPPADDNSTTATFTFEADTDPVTFRCRLDANPEADCTSPHDEPGLADGAHTFAVTAYNADGVPDPTPATHSWTIDSSTPDTQIDGGPGGVTGSVVGTANATFMFSSSDAGAGATFTCRLDGAAFTACTSPKNYPGLAEGVHTFAVRVRDAVGNVDPSPAMWSWTVDLTEPDTTILTHPPALTNQTGATFTFDSTESPATFECRLDAAAFAACTSPQVFASLTEGSHTFRVRSTDEAGNVDPSPAVSTWAIDLTPPNTTLTGGPGAVTNQTAATFAVGASETGSTIQCRIDGGAYADCTGGTAMYTGLGAGAHTVEAFATDAAGNPDPTPASRTWTIDLTAPTVTNVTSTTANGTYNDGALINVQVVFSEAVTVTGAPTVTLETGATNRTATFQAGSGTATLTFSYTVIAGDQSPDLDYVGTGSLGLGGGTIRDAATNDAVLTLATPGAAGSLGANKNIVIDAIAPSITNVTSSTPNGTYGIASTISIQVTFSEAVTVTGTPVLLLETGAINESATYASGSGSSTLSFTYVVQTGDNSGDLDYVTSTSLFGTIRDAVGNDAVMFLPAPGASGSLGANKNLVIDGIAPLVTITSPGDGDDVGPRVTYAWTVNDGSATQCRFDGGPLQACTSPITTNLPAGAHSILVAATDGTGNTGTDTNNFTVVCGPQTGGPGGYVLFHLDDGTGQLALDSIPPPQNAVLGTETVTEAVDPLWTSAGRFGGALRFDQVSRDTVSWPSGAAAPLSTHDHTLEMWARMNSSASSGGGVLWRSGDGRMIVGYRDNGTLMEVFYRLLDDTGLQHEVTATSVDYGVYRHIVATYTGSTMSLWVDGAVKTGTASFSSTINLGTTAWGIPSNHIDGVVDEVYFGTQALTSAEVLDRYCPL